MPGAEAVRTKGWFLAWRWLLARRVSQISIMGLFLLGPLADLWWIKGNLSSSLVLNTVPLTDPFLLLQTLAAGHLPVTTALLGALFVLGFYAMLGGRIFCSWVCPVNVVTDTAGWLRRRLDIRKTSKLSRSMRFWMLGMALLVPGLTGYLVWELVNPVSLLHRGLIFGMGMGWTLILGIFLFDLFVSRRGWCGHLCPMGAFYNLLGSVAEKTGVSLIKVNAKDRSRCNDCMDCFAVCPEPQVIKPALKGKGSPVIIASDCTQCGRCIDVCAQEVFHYNTRFAQFDATTSTGSSEYATNYKAEK
ncbi:MAG: quinol dehydrogenase ferredoxin subunit NapH [Hahellaceae bacterium]|nr:quinol dehydrogenase ferredoxin subunit NapH [Hahellaceae bacterium]MCP5168302.1 quinol dehydrogenase ferredoxin subunit NapH [Hahellaceae bacterium]